MGIARVHNSSGFKGGLTFIEAIVVVTVILIISAAVLPRLLDSFVSGGDDTWGDAKDIAHFLSIAQSNAASNRDNDHVGVHLVDNGTTDCGTATAKDCVVTYKGTNFSARDSSYDQTFVLRANNQFNFPVAQSGSSNKDCRTAAEVDGPGSDGWSTESNACASNNSYAQVAGFVGTESEYLQLTDFSIDVPAGARIDGIKVSIERKGTSGCITDSDVKIVKRGSIKSVDKAAAGNWPSSDTTKDYGGSTDLWGEAWTTADINATDFGVALSAFGSGLCFWPTASVDNVAITVYYAANFNDQDFYFNKVSGLGKDLYGVPANPVAYYSFENATSSDMSGNGYEGSMTSVSFQSSGGARDSSYADVNGSTSYVDIGNPAWPSGLSARTLCAWARTDTTTGSHAIVSYGTSGSSQEFYIGSNGTSLEGGGGASTISSASFWDTSNWHHVCLTYDGTSAALYGDGTRLVDPTAKTWSAVLSKAYLGRHVNDSNYWDGRIDDVLLFDRALAADEIKQLYELTGTTQPYKPAPSQIFIVNGTATSTVEVYADGLVRALD